MQYQLIANAVTTVSLVLGFSSIFLAINFRFYWASCFIIAAVLCDIIDGNIARMSEIPSEFGKEFDSLTDLVSFGVAPGVLVYMFAFFKDTFRLQDIALVCLYLTCGAFRLARFNIYSRAKFYNYFKGLPITASGAFFASFVLWVQRFNVNIRSEFWWPVLLIFSFLMYSTIKYPNFKNFKITKRFSGIILLLVIIAAAFISKGVVLLLLFSLYVILGPFLVRSKDAPALPMGSA